MKFHVVGLVVLCVLMSTVTKAESKAEQLIGTWYAMKQTDDGETMKWLVKRIDAQHYASLFMICSGENLSWVQKEIGTWAFENDALTHSPVTIEDFTGKKEVQPGSDTTYTDVTLTENTLSYKKAGEFLMTFTAVDGNHQVSCK